MLSVQQFEMLLESPESSILDFKREMYHFDNDSDKKKIGGFVKDILSFCNTIRSKTSYIIIGIDEDEGRLKNLIGIDQIIDDSILQEKVNSKVYPKPNFSFYVIDYNDLKFGVFEFPIAKYSNPLVAVEKLKGIEVGRIYHRKGSSNSEANGIEGIHIHEWLKSLSENPSNSLIKEVSLILKRISSSNEKLSEILSDLYVISKDNRLEEIECFCRTELIGFQEIRGLMDTPKEDKYRYRVIKIYQSLYEIDPDYLVTSSMIKAELESNQKVNKVEFLFNYTIHRIEDFISKTDSSKEDRLITSKIDFKELFPNSNEEAGTIMVYRYMFESDFQILYRKISNKLVELLCSIK